MSEIKKVLFLDIDGPMIPGRAYSLPNQTKPLVMTFDPCAVAMLNDVCSIRGWKIVLHSSWVRIFGGQKTHDHCIEQGVLKEHFHNDQPYCDEEENWRYTRVAKWLKEHPEVDSYVILDDEPYEVDLYSKYPHPKNMKAHLIRVDFEDGLLSEHYRRLRDGKWKINTSAAEPLDYDLV